MLKLPKVLLYIRRNYQITWDYKIMENDIKSSWLMKKTMWFKVL
jgi:hypothetical protein